MHEHVTASQEKDQQECQNKDLQRTRMMYWGYRFESLTVIHQSPKEVSPQELSALDKARATTPISPEVQYCQIGQLDWFNMKMILGAEVDCVEPATDAAIELKTHETVKSPAFYEKKKLIQKLRRGWIQSSLMGIPKLVIGFRSARGLLESIREYPTGDIPHLIQPDMNKLNPRKQPGVQGNPPARDASKGHARQGPRQDARGAPWSPLTGFNFARGFFKHLHETCLKHKETTYWVIRYQAPYDEIQIEGYAQGPPNPHQRRVIPA
jgi:hypothetical protein